MSDELKLPEELAAFEALLAAKPLAAAGVDRDELMYRAGWAACQTADLQPRVLPGGRLEVAEGPSVVRDYHPAEPGAARARRQAVGWSAASAALAASVAVAAMLGWEVWRARNQAEDAGGGTPRLAAAVEAPSTDEIQGNDDRPHGDGFALHDVDRLAGLSGREPGVALTGPWLAMQRRQTSTRPNDRVEEVAVNGEAPAAPKTARELREELLPHESTPRASLWPWQSRSNGESI